MCVPTSCICHTQRYPSPPVLPYQWVASHPHLVSHPHLLSLPNHPIFFASILAWTPESRARGKGLGQGCKNLDSDPRAGGLERETRKGNTKRCPHCGHSWETKAQAARTLWGQSRIPREFFPARGKKEGNIYSLVSSFFQLAHEVLAPQHLGCTHVCATWVPVAAPRATESRGMSSCWGRLLLGYFCVNLVAAAMAGGKNGHEDMRQGMSVEL